MSLTRRAWCIDARISSPMKLMVRSRSMVMRSTRDTPKGAKAVFHLVLAIRGAPPLGWQRKCPVRCPINSLRGEKADDIPTHRAGSPLRSSASRACASGGAGVRRPIPTRRSVRRAPIRPAAYPTSAASDCRQSACRSASVRTWLIENRSGAAGAVGANGARGRGDRSAAPCWYRMARSSPSTPQIASKPSYEPQRDLAPVAHISRTLAPLFLAVHPKVPVATLKEYHRSACRSPSRRAQLRFVRRRAHLTISRMEALGCKGAATRT